MGQGQGSGEIVDEEPLLAHPDFSKNGTKFSEKIETDLKAAVLALSQTHETFLIRHPAYFKNDDDFQIEDFLGRSQNALTFDKRLVAWMPSLVPKKISETEFWRNYFSHVSSLINQAVSGKITLPKQPPPPSSTPPDSVIQNHIKETQSENNNSSNIEEKGEISFNHFGLTDGEEVEVEDEVDENEIKMDEEKRRKLEGLFSEYIEQDVEDVRSGQYGDPIRWGIIGCGDVCEWKSGPAFKNARGSLLVAVMSRTSARAKRYAERHNVGKWYSDASALIKDPDVEAVYIASPPGSHLELAKMVCAEGKPCFVEKPMARSYEECKQMVDVFFRNSLPLFVAYYRRAQPRFIRAQEIVHEHLGQITSINCRYLSRKHLDQSKSEIGWRVECEESGGGLFMDMASHTIDILDFLFGPLDHIYGDAVLNGSIEDIDVETVVSMTFRTKSKAIGICLWNFVSSIDEDVLDITGTQGRMTMSIFGKEPPTLHLQGPKDVISRQVSAPFPKYVHQPLVQTICDELRGVPDRVCPSAGYTAKRTARVMDIVLRKYYRDRTDDFWRRPHSWDNHSQKQLQPSDEQSG